MTHCAFISTSLRRPSRALGACIALGWAFTVAAPATTKDAVSGGREFLFMGDNTTTYLFRGRELQRMEGNSPLPAPQDLEPLPVTPVTDPRSTLPATVAADIAKQIETFAQQTDFRAFVVMAAPEDFEDFAWRLQDSVRFGANQGNEVILLFTSEPGRVAVLFGPAVVISFGRNQLTQISKEAAPTAPETNLSKRILEHVRGLLSRLANPDNLPGDSDAPKGLFFAGSEPEPSSEEASQPAANAVDSTAKPSLASSSSEREADALARTAPRPANEDAWRTITLVLVCVLIPSIIIGAAIAFSAVANRRKKNDQPPVQRIDIKPLSSASGFPARRVKPAKTDAEPVEPVPRDPPEDRRPAPQTDRRPASQAERGREPASAPSDSSWSLGTSAPYRAAHSAIQEVTFAEGEQAKINELLASLRLLQDADADTTVEVLALVRTLLSELKDIASASEFSQLSATTAER